jgi:hypothetical protein
MSDIAAQSSEPIRYTPRFPAPHTHYVEVEAVYPSAGRPELDLMMAVWTPGSYLVREYERHVEGLTATTAGGAAATAARTSTMRSWLSTIDACGPTVWRRGWSSTRPATPCACWWPDATAC